MVGDLENRYPSAYEMGIIDQDGTLVLVVAAICELLKERIHPDADWWLAYYHGRQAGRKES